MKKLRFAIVILLICSCSENADQDISSNSDTLNLNKNALEEDGSNSGLSYLKIKERNGVELKNDSLKKIIDSYFEAEPSPGIESLTDFILEMTERQLTFTFGKCSSDPQSLTKDGNANCVGYAAFFNSLMNYALRKKVFAGKYKCHHYVGKIFYDDTNVNALFKNDPFFKDHDYNSIESKEGKNIAVDPSLYEYLGIKRVSTKKPERK